MIERAIAKKCCVEEILQQPLDRINLIAIVVEKEGGKSIMLDDGSGVIEARSFNDNNFFSNIDIGKAVLLIGRPRKFEGRTYVVGEIVRQLENKTWVELRKAELEGRTKEVKKEATEKPSIEEVVEESETLTNLGDRVLATIRELDQSGGAPSEDVIAKVNHQDAEKTLNNLMAEGEIFEVKPGRVKVLE